MTNAITTNPLMKKRYDTLLEKLDAKNESAFVPFFCLGNPTLDATMAMVDTAIDNGADALELGFPFSDPVADGPVLQTANIRGIKSGAYPDKCLEMIGEIRAKYPDVPIGLLLYCNITFAMGVDTFYARCASVGVDSVLVADVPVEECEEWHASALKHGVAPIFIAPPNATGQKLTQLAHLGAGYTYVVARSGVTGTDASGVMSGDAIVKQLLQLNAPAPFIGFGISSPTDVKQALKSGAKGVIVGSKIAKIIDMYVNYETIDKDGMVDAIGTYVSEMKSATKGR